MKRTAVWLILFFAFCGIADSAYIAESAATGTPLICNVADLTGCNIVAQSAYNNIFGIPLADYGILFYGLLFILAAIEIAIDSKLVRRAIQVIAVVDFLSSLVFVYIQIVLIGALCIYCLASAALSLFIFLCSLALEKWPRLRPRRAELPITITIDR